MTARKASARTATRTSRPKAARMLAADLARIITDAALFACRDNTLPMINAVRLESSAKQLMAIATDRFTLGASIGRYDDETPGHEFAVDLKLTQAQQLARIAKSCKKGHVSIASRVAGTAFQFSTGEQLTLPTQAGSPPFPDWRAIVSKVSGEDDPAAKLIGFNPQYMSRFGRVANARNMHIRVGAANAPTFVKVGDEFFGLIMPIRIVEDWTTPAWLGLPEPELAPAPKPAPRKRKPKTAKPAA